MTEHLTLLGRADPLGHFYLPEDHSDCQTARWGCGPDRPAWEENDVDACPRSAKSIVLSTRNHVPVKL